MSKEMNALALSIMNEIQRELNKGDFTELLANFAEEYDAEDICTQRDLESWANRNDFVPLSDLEEAQNEIKNLLAQINNLELELAFEKENKE